MNMHILHMYIYVCYTCTYISVTSYIHVHVACMRPVVTSTCLLMYPTNLHMRIHIEVYIYIYICMSMRWPYVSHFGFLKTRRQITDEQQHTGLVGVFVTSGIAAGPLDNIPVPRVLVVCTFVVCFSGWLKNKNKP